MVIYFFKLRRFKASVFLKIIQNSKQKLKYYAPSEQNIGRKIDVAI